MLTRVNTTSRTHQNVSCPPKDFLHKLFNCPKRGLAGPVDDDDRYSNTCVTVLFVIFWNMSPALSLQLLQHQSMKDDENVYTGIKLEWSSCPNIAKLTCIAHSYGRCIAVRSTSVRPREEAH